jgi:hypothetical protein
LAHPIPAAKPHIKVFATHRQNGRQAKGLLLPQGKSAFSSFFQKAVGVWGNAPNISLKEHFFGSLKPFFAIEKKVSKLKFTLLRHS